MSNGLSPILISCRFWYLLLQVDKAKAELEAAGCVPGSSGVLLACRMGAPDVTVWVPF